MACNIKNIASGWAMTRNKVFLYNSSPKNMFLNDPLDYLYGARTVPDTVWVDDHNWALLAKP
jgi:hypothetical protein